MSTAHGLTQAQISILDMVYATQAEAAKAVRCSLRTYTRVLKGQCRRGKSLILIQDHANALLARQPNASGLPLPPSSQPDRLEA